jgi:hypothetical protein
MLKISSQCILKLNQINFRDNFLFIIINKIIIPNICAQTLNSFPIRDFHTQQVLYFEKNILFVIIFWKKKTIKLNNHYK